MSDRLKQIQISATLLGKMFTEGWEVGTDHIVRCVGGLPSDAQYVRGWVNESLCVVHLVFSHPSFTEVELGQNIPVLDVKLQQFERVTP